MKYLTEGALSLVQGAGVGIGFTLAAGLLTRYWLLGWLRDAMMATLLGG